MTAGEACDRAHLPSRRLMLRGAIGCAGALVAPLPLWARSAARSKGTRSVAFHNLHTGERLRAEYWQNGRYVPGALHAVSVVLRDHRNNKTHPIDPQLLDLLHVLSATLRSGSPLEVISGYRSPESNALLREASDGVAAHSLHMEGKAIDIRLPGTPLARLRNAALSLELGGVGYYPADDFVHVDTGRVRRWGGAA